MSWRDMMADVLTAGAYGRALAVQNNAADLLKRLDEAAGVESNEAVRRLSISQRFSAFASALDFRVASALASIFTTVQSHRSEIIKAVDDVKSFYLAVAIIDQIAEDALTPDVSTDEIIRVTSKNETVQKRINELEDRIGKFDILVNDIKRDLLCYGEYTLRTEVDGPGTEEEKPADPSDPEPVSFQQQRQADLMADPSRGTPQNGSAPARPPRGLLAIHDDVDQSRVIAITESGQITGYLTISEDRRSGTVAGTATQSRKVEIKPPSAYIKFTLQHAKIRVKITDDPLLKSIRASEDFMRRVPRYVRVGRSILFPVLSKIKELQLLEQIVPASKIQMLTGGTIVGMQVPGGFDIKKGFEAAAQAEQLINKKIGVDTLNQQINVENILSTVGQIKVLPQFGDKGQFQRYDYKPEEPDKLLESIEDLRKVILSSVGVPFELIFGGESAMSKGELLKRYARYLRRLKSIQQAIADGIRQIVEIHLVNTKTDFVPSDDIQIEFRNKLIQIDLLDELEFLDTTVGMLGNTLRFLGITEELMSKVTNIKELMTFLSEKLKVLGMEKVIDPRKAKDLADAEKTADDTLAQGGAAPEQPPPEAPAKPEEPSAPPESPPASNGGGGGQSGQ